MNKNNCICFSNNQDILEYDYYRLFQENFVISNNNNNTFEEFKKNVENSFFAPYIKYAKCKYNDQIMEDYQQTKEKMYVKIYGPL